MPACMPREYLIFNVIFNVILFISFHSSVSLISVDFNVDQKLDAYYAASFHSASYFPCCHPFTFPSYSSSSSSTFPVIPTMKTFCIFIFLCESSVCSTMLFNYLVQL